MTVWIKWAKYLIKKITSVMNHLMEETWKAGKQTDHIILFTLMHLSSLHDGNTSKLYVDSQKQQFDYSLPSLFSTAHRYRLQPQTSTFQLYSPMKYWTLSIRAQNSLDPVFLGHLNPCMRQIPFQQVFLDCFNSYFLIKRLICGQCASNGRFS